MLCYGLKAFKVDKALSKVRLSFQVSEPFEHYIPYFSIWIR
jgi:hypothetical protein